MQSLLAGLLSLCAITAHAQVDTMYTTTERIACSVKEVTPNAVQYVYPNETMINSLYQNMVKKIVFRSGRTQVFSQSALSTINGIDDYTNITITQVDGEINGLHNLGEVSSSSRGGSVYANIDRVRDRAVSKLRMAAAMKGANIIYIAYQKTGGNRYGGYFQTARAAETMYTGVAYSDYLPPASELMNKLKNTAVFTSRYQIVLPKGASISKSTYTFGHFETTVKVTRVYKENDRVYIEGKIQGFDAPTFRVVRYNTSTFTILAEDKNRLVNFVIPFER